MRVYVLRHETDGVMGVFRTVAGAKRHIHSVPASGWKYVESLAWHRNGDFVIQEEELRA